MALTKVSTGLISADLASVDLNIDANTLYLDVSNNRVGIGNTGPTTALDVTGTVTADGLTVVGETTSSNGTYGTKLTYSNGNQSGIIDTFGNHNLEFRANDDRAMNIAANGDISFYEDTGTTAKFFWDASAEYLSVGGTTGTFAPINFIGSNGRLGLNDGNTSGGVKIQSFAATNVNGYLAFEGWDKEYMRIDSSGNLLVGKTSSSFSVAGIGLMANDQIFATATSDNALALNRLSTDGDIAKFYKDGSTVGSIGTTSSNVVIGTGNTGLRFYDGGSAIIPHTAAGGASNGLVDLGQGGFNQFKDLYLSGNAMADNFVGTSDTDTFIAMTGSNVMRFFTGNSEAARFNSSGNLLVGKSSQVSAGRFGVQYDSGQHGIGIDQDFSGGGTLINFLVQDSAVGSVQTNGTTTSYNTSSDQRLKENIVDAPSASDDIDAIQVRSFDWKADGSHQKYGMIAQELVTVAPEAVSQPKDPEEMMGVDYSKLVPMMLKEIQQLRARVAQLEGAN